MKLLWSLDACVWCAAFLAVVLLPGLATTARSADGVLEINQACAAQSGCFSGDAAGLPVTIDGSAGKSYVLTSDLELAGTNGIEVRAPLVRVDLNGFTIRATSNPGGVHAGIADDSSAAVRGTSVRNGAFDLLVINYVAVSLQDRAQVSDLRVRAGLGGIDVGANSIVTRNVVHSSERAIRTGDSSIVSENSVVDVNGTGIETGASSQISRNVVSGTIDDGIRAGAGSTIIGNTANGSRENPGINCDACTLADNTVQGNVQGIVCSTCSVVGNTVVGNEFSGVSVSQGSTVHRNTIRGNGFSGGSTAGIGLGLSADSTYRENTITGNAGGAVSGGVNLGDNYCEGTGVVSATCP